MIAAVMGWIGTVGSLSAFIMLSQGRWHATSLRYSTLNFFAAGLAGSASVVYGAWPSAASNLLWSAIACHTMIATLRRRRATRPVLRPLPPVPSQATAEDEAATVTDESDYFPDRRLTFLSAA